MKGKMQVFFLIHTLIGLLFGNITLLICSISMQGHNYISIVFRGYLLMSRTTDSDSDHGLGPWSVRLIMSVGLGPRTRSDLLPRTRSAQYNRRLRNLPLMSDSVRSPRCLVGAFDVGLGPDSLRLDPV